MVAARIAGVVAVSELSSELPSVLERIRHGERAEIEQRGSVIAVISPRPMGHDRERTHRQDR